MLRRHVDWGACVLVCLLLAGAAAAQPLDQPLLLALTGTTLVQTGTPPVRQASGSRRRLAQQPEPAGRCLTCGRDSGACGCVVAGAYAAGYQCTPEATAQAAAVCTQLPSGVNTTQVASLASTVQGAGFADGVLSRAAGGASAATGAIPRPFTFYGQCRRAWLTGHASCDFVFDTAAVRVLRAMAAVVAAPAGASGDLTFEACSLGLGNVSIASGTCFTYDLAKPVVVRLETVAAVDSLPAIAFWATYRDSAGTSPKHLVVADLRVRSSHIF